MRSTAVGLVVLAFACGGPTTVVNDNGTYPVAIAARAGFVYWVDFFGGTVQRAALDGSARTTVASGQTRPASIAVDDSFVYWANNGLDVSSCSSALPQPCTNPDGAVLKAPIAGGAPIVLASALCLPDSIAIDGANVYVAEGGSGVVIQVPLAGGTTTVLAAAQLVLGPVAVDATSVYWTSQTADFLHNVITKTPIGGGALTVLSSDTPQLFYGAGCGATAPALAVDSTSVYWAAGALNTTTSIGTPSLMKMPVGGGAETAIASIGEPASTTYGAIIVDATDAYWSDGDIRKTPLTGGDVTSLGSATEGIVTSFAITGNTLLWASPEGGLISSVSK